LRLSRLSHRLPRREAHPQIMERTADFHHQITDALLPQANAVFHDATALDATIDMFDPQAALMPDLIGQCLRYRQLLAARFLRRHEDVHVGQREGQETEILQQLVVYPYLADNP